MYYVGAQAPTSVCNPSCTYLTNAGAQTTIQVISTQVTGCLSYWIGDDSAANLWGQVGYYICNGASPLAFYEIWNLTSGAVLTTGTTSVTTGYHTFSMYSMSGGATWAYALDGTVFGTYNMGAGLSLGTFPVQAVSEEGLVAGPWTPPQVTFSTAMQTYLTASTYPSGNGWTAVASAFEPWGGCTSTGTANNSGGYTCWGIAGNLQDGSIQANALVTGGSRALLRAGASLWTGGTPDFTLTASPSTVTMNPGSAGTSTITVASLSGFTGTVSLASSISPTAGLSCTLTPGSVSGGAGTSTLSCSGSAGTYTITVTGSSGSLAHTTSVSFNVNGGTTLTFSFAVQGGGSGYSAPTLTYVRSGVTSTVPLTGTATAVTVDANSAWSVANPLTGSSSTERWQTAQASSGTATASITIVFTYYHQFSATFGYTVRGGGSGETTPSVAAVRFGSAISLGTSVSAWVDAGSSYAYANPLGGSSTTERWIAVTASGSVTSATTVSATYFHQYSVSFSYVVQGGGTGYGAPTAAYQSLGSSASTATGIAVWADAGTSYTLTDPLSGSTSTAAWRTGSGTGSVSAAGGISATYYYQYLVAFLVQVLNGNAPTTAPSLSATVFGSTATITAGGSSWVDAGGSYAYPASFSGTAGERWTSASPANGTVTLSGTITASYYHQFSIAFAYKVSGGGSPSGAPSVAYVGLGTSLATTAGTTVWVDAGSAYGYAAALPGGSSAERWITPAAGGTATTTGTITATYLHQFWIDFTFTVKGGGIGFSAPSVTYSNLSTPVSVSATTSWVWADAGTAYAYQNPLPGSNATSSWQTNNGIGTSSASATFTATYRHQYKVKFTASTLSGAPTPESPLVNVTVFGANVTLAADSVSWVDAGGMYSFPGVFYGPLPGERWVTSTPPSGLVLGPVNITATYDHQFFLAIQVNAPQGGTITGTAGWYAQGATMTLHASAEAGWQFQGWIGSGTGSYTGSAATAPAAMNAPVTETAVFYVGVTLTASDGGSLQYSYGGTTGWVPAGGTAVLYLAPATNLTIRAEPSLFHQLDGWSSSATGTATDVVLVPQAPLTVTANYGLSWYSKLDSVLSIVLLGTAALILALSVRRHRRKVRALAARKARLNARARA